MSIDVALMAGATLAAALAAAILTGWVRQYALARAILDRPNDRSSHAVPTPRGGGAAIMVVVLLAIAGIGGARQLPYEHVLALLGCIPIAAIGVWDDVADVSPGLRLLVQVIAAAWSVYWAGGLPDLDLGVAVVPLPIVGNIAAILGIIWATNLYNFMDGIDGIAAAETTSVALVGGGLLIAGGELWLGIIAAITAGAAAGFLRWNWQPAKIFMGDVGSASIGFLLAVLALLSERTGAVPILLWVLLAGVFLLDASLTLLRRAAAGQRVYTAHRSHAYQRTVQAGMAHSRVVGWVLAMNVVLAILATAGWLRRDLILLLFGVAVAMLLTVYFVVEGKKPMDTRRNGSQ